MVARMFAVFVLVALALVIETTYVATGILVFDDLMRALSGIIALEILMAAIILDDTVKFAFTVFGILGVTVFGSMLVYGAFS
jgi:hypothetical protein